MVRTRKHTLPSSEARFQARASTTAGGMGSEVARNFERDGDAKKWLRA